MFESEANGVQADICNSGCQVRKHDFNALCSPLLEELTGFAHKRTHDRHIAEDIVQQAYFNALRAWNRFDPGDEEPEDAARSWMYRIVKNAATNMYQQQKRREEMLEEHYAEIAECAQPDGSSGDGMSEEIAEAVSSLPPFSREVIEGMYIKGETRAQLALRLGLAEGTIDSRIARAKARLQRRLKAYGRRSGYLRR